MAYGGTGGIEILVTDTDLPLALELIADQEDDAA
jgi:hypothetical protein